MGIAPWSYINSVSQAAIRDSRTFYEASSGEFSEEELDSSIEEDARGRGFIDSAMSYYDTVYRATLQVYFDIADSQDDED